MAEEKDKQKLAQPVLLRPHHGMCLAYFKGEGYSDGFSAHMKDVLDELQKGMNVRLQMRFVLPVRIIGRADAQMWLWLKNMTMPCWRPVLWQMGSS